MFKAQQPCVRVSIQHCTAGNGYEGTPNRLGQTDCCGASATNAACMLLTVLLSRSHCAQIQNCMLFRSATACRVRRFAACGPWCCRCWMRGTRLTSARSTPSSTVYLRCAGCACPCQGFNEQTLVRRCKHLCQAPMAQQCAERGSATAAAQRVMIYAARHGMVLPTAPAPWCAS